LPAYRPVRGLPRLAPGRPALVQNVETLAHLALIARYGASWFRLAGTEAEPGSMLATLHLADGRTNVTEVPLGIGLADLLGVARYLALESAGQCGPCFNGLPRIAAAVDHLAGPRPDQRARADLERWAGLVTGRGACHHPDGSVRFIRSALHVFAAEAALHERG